MTGNWRIVRALIAAGLAFAASWFISEWRDGDGAERLGAHLMIAAIAGALPFVLDWWRQRRMRLRGIQMQVASPTLGDIIRKINAIVRKGNRAGE